MRFRRLVLAACAVAATSLVTPAHADPVEEDFGPAVVDFRYNDGEVGVISLAYGGPGGSRLDGPPQSRPMSADCNFAIEPNVNSSAITVDIVATATAGADAPVYPAATGVTCTVTLGNGQTRSVAAAGPTAMAVARDRFTFTSFQSPITLCSTPNVLWSDNVFQRASVPVCKTS